VKMASKYQMKCSGLISKLLAGIVLIEVMMLSILVYNSVRLLNSTHAELFQRTIDEETMLLGSLLLNGLSVRDLAQINENLQLFSRQKNVKYAVVYDRHNHVMGKVGDVPNTISIDKRFQDAFTDGVFDTVYEVKFEGELFGTLKAGFSITEIAQLSEKAKLQNTIIALTEIALSVLVTIIIGLYLIRRIASLRDGARQLQKGEYDYQLPVREKDELGELAEAFNQLGASLAHSNREIQEKQQEIQQRAARFSRLLNSVNAIIFQASINPFSVNYVNQEAENLLGYLPEDWQQPGFFKNIIHPEDYAMFENFALQPDSKLFRAFDYRARKKDGEFIWLRQIVNLENSNNVKILHGILIDVTTEKRNLDVERARDIAIAENRTKNLFMANMSHELRTPLNAIIGYTELIAEDCGFDEPLDKNQVVEDLDKVSRSAKHLLRLINGILDLSKINADKLDLEITEFRISELLDEVAVVIEPLASKNKNQFVVKLSQDITVRADHQRLYQIIVNICSNACKFTYLGAIVLSVEYLEGDKFYNINVADTGNGIKSEDIGKLFREFARSQDVSEIEGTGLGLCLSQKLCKTMGGYISVASEFGKGSTFTISMPQHVKPLVADDQNNLNTYVTNRLSGGKF